MSIDTRKIAGVLGIIILSMQSAYAMQKAAKSKWVDAKLKKITFTCEQIPKRQFELAIPESWTFANDIGTDTPDGKLFEIEPCSTDLQGSVDKFPQLRKTYKELLKNATFKISRTQSKTIAETGTKAVRVTLIGYEIVFENKLMISVVFRDEDPALPNLEFFDSIVKSVK